MTNMSGVKQHSKFNPLKKLSSGFNPTLRVASNLMVAFVIGLGYVPHEAYAQTLTATTPGRWLDNIIGIENSGIINGAEYRIEFLGTKTNPFFLPEASEGFIQYNNQQFYAPLLYDIYKDEIIVKHLSSAGRAWLIQLDKKLVKEFTIQGHLFRNFNGIYREVLFDGDNLLLVSRKSKFAETKNGIPNYREHEEYFLFRSGKWKRVVGSSGFASMLESKEDKRQLKVFLKQNKIKVGKFNPDDLAKVAAFVNALRNKKS
jgi:hypothetical protein